jgi:DNA repair photolyase
MLVMKHMKQIERFKHLGDDFFQVMDYYRDYGPTYQYGSLEHYDRCSYRCVYCITESQGKTRAKFTADEIETHLDREFSVLNDNWIICMGAAMDPYNDLEPELRLTRRALQMVKKYGLRFTMTTKGTSILDDIDFYRTYDHWFKTILSLSVLDPELERMLEPGAPSTSDRIDAALELRNAGVPEVWVAIAPWVPQVSNLEAIFERLPDGMPVAIQPLEIGEEFEEPLDQKSSRFSAKASVGKKWSFDEINAQYVDECNRLYNEYIKKFPRMEWRWPIMKNTHDNNQGYFRQLKPGNFQPEDFLPEDSELLNLIHSSRG